MNASFGKVLDSVQRGYASSLIGKEVSFTVRAEDGTVGTRTGKVEEVAIGEDGQINLVVDDRKVSLADVLSIRE